MLALQHMPSFLMTSLTRSRAAAPGVDFEMIVVPSKRDGLALLASDPRPFDILVCYYGYKGRDRQPTFAAFMEALQDFPLNKRAPVVCFATLSGEFAASNRRVALRAGAADFCTTGLGLIRKFAQILHYDRD